MIQTKTFVTCDICGETIIGEYYNCVLNMAQDPEQYVPNANYYGTWQTISLDGYIDYNKSQTHVCKSCWNKMKGQT